MKTLLVVLLIIFGVMWFATQVNLNGAPTLKSYSASTYARAKPTPKLFHDVVYKITSGDYGSQWIDVTYEMPSGTAQKTTCICKHAKTAVVDTLVATSGQFVYLSAQNDETNSPIRCEIYVDGVLTYQVESFGPHKIASCSGRIP